MKISKAIIFCLLSICTAWFSDAEAQRHDKQRLIVTTDLGGADPDDIQSLLHLLLCSDRIDLEGLISSPAWVDAPDNTKEIEKVVAAFGEVLPNLKAHSKDFPTMEHLKSIIKCGQAKSNMDGVGVGKDSPGSDLIITSVDKKDARPVWLAAWGGMNTIAQAIWKARETRSEADFQRFISKIRIYDILGQDDAGAWIAKNFPNIIYIRNTKVYGWAPSDEWTKENVQSRLPLGNHYPNRVWATEGDSPAFLYVYANGLNALEHIDFGGWGGRFSQDKGSNVRGMDFIARSGKDESQYDEYQMYVSSAEGISAIGKWKQQIWNNFAARMLWSTTDDYSAVNHHPIAVVNGKKSYQFIEKKVKAGTRLTFDASRSTDPDNDLLDYECRFTTNQARIREV